MLILICNLYKSVDDLLPHFYRHYEKLGIDRYVFGVWNGEQNVVWRRVKEIIPPNTDVILDTSYGGEILARKEVQSHIKLRYLYGSDNDWFVPTDLDEFHITPWTNDFKEAIDLCESVGADFVVGDTVDRITLDGTIPMSINDEDIFVQFPRNAMVTKNIVRAWSEKVCLQKGTVEITEGHHYARGKPYRKRSITYHLKWFGDLLSKEREKLKIYKNAGDVWHEENHRLLKHLEENNNRLIL